MHAKTDTHNVGSKTIRVLHIVHWSKSGIGIVVDNIAQHSSMQLVHAVLLLNPAHDVAFGKGLGNVRVYCPRSAGVFQWVRQLRIALREFEPHIVHAHSLVPRMASVLCGKVKRVSTIHTRYSYFLEVAPRSLLKRGAEVVAQYLSGGSLVCVSPEVRDALPTAGMRSRAQVICNGVDLERLKQVAQGVESIEARFPALIAVGRLDREKGFDKLISAFAIVRSRYHDARLQICGEGIERPHLSQLIAELELSDAIDLVGFVEAPEKLVANAHLYVSSSEQEGFGLATAEALSLGVPVVTTPTAGLGTALRDGVHAFVTDGYDVNSIANATISALSDRTLLKRIGKEGQQFAMDNLSVKEMVRSYERVYFGLMEGGGNCD